MVTAAIMFLFSLNAVAGIQGQHKGPFSEHDFNRLFGFPYRPTGTLATPVSHSRQTDLIHGNGCSYGSIDHMTTVRLSDI